MTGASYVKGRARRRTSRRYARAHMVSYRPARLRFVAVIAVVAVAVGASAVPSVAAPAAARTDRWDPRIAPIAKEVAKLRKLDFEHPVPVEFLDDEAFNKK